MVKSQRLVLKGDTVTKGMWEKITDAMQEVGMIVKRKGKPAQVNFLPEKRYEYIEVVDAMRGTDSETRKDSFVSPEKGTVEERTGIST